MKILGPPKPLSISTPGGGVSGENGLGLGREDSDSTVRGRTRGERGGVGGGGGGGE